MVVFYDDIPNVPYLRSAEYRLHGKQAVFEIDPECFVKATNPIGKFQRNHQVVAAGDICVFVCARSADAEPRSIPGAPFEGTVGPKNGAREQNLGLKERLYPFEPVRWGDAVGVEKRYVFAPGPLKNPVASIGSAPVNWVSKALEVREVLTDSRRQGSRRIGIVTDDDFESERGRLRL